MPLISISLIKGRSPDEKRAVASSVHSALVQTFRIPEKDINIRITEYAQEDFLLSPGKTSHYALVEITAFKGRSLDAKRSLYKAVVENLGKLGVDPNDIMIVIHEEELYNWGIRGGIPASEVDLGFNVKV